MVLRSALCWLLVDLSPAVVDLLGIVRSAYRLGWSSCGKLTMVTPSTPTT
jgi:hypothetical protein